MIGDQMELLMDNFDCGIEALKHPRPFQNNRTVNGAVTFVL